MGTYTAVQVIVEPPKNWAVTRSTGEWVRS